jgi:hypothetical protein
MSGPYKMASRPRPRTAATRAGSTRYRLGVFTSRLIRLENQAGTMSRTNIRWNSAWYARAVLASMPAAPRRLSSVTRPALFTARADR